MIKKILIGSCVAVMMTASALACGSDCDVSKCKDPANCPTDKVSSAGYNHFDIIAKAEAAENSAVTVTNDKYKLIYKIESDGIDFFIYDKATGKEIGPNGVTGKLTLADGTNLGIGAMAMGDEPKAHLMSMETVKSKKLTGKVTFKLPDGQRIQFDLK